MRFDIKLNFVYYLPFFLVLLVFSLMCCWSTVVFASDDKNSQVDTNSLVRGSIYDRGGTLLVGNKSSFNLQLTPGKIHCASRVKQSECLNQLIDAINDQISVSKSDYQNFWQIYQRTPSSKLQAITIRHDLNKREMHRIATKFSNTTGVAIVPEFTRQRYYDNAISHIIGTVENKNGVMLGVSGIEKQYNQLLQGSADQSRRRKRSHQSKNIYLTIDIHLQKYAEDLLANHSGSIVALDPNTGEVLALVSKSGTGGQLNLRALTYAYPPGSTIKPFYGLASLYYDAMNPAQSINCTGKFYVPGSNHVWRDWKPEGHGKVNLHKAIAESCNTYFYGLAVKIGIDKISSFLQLFGIGEKTGIDMPFEALGVLPSRQYKINRYKEAAAKKAVSTQWFMGDTINIGIGQGYIAITPMQLALAVSTIAMRGRMMQPHLLLAHEVADKSKTLYPHPKVKRVLSQIKKQDWEYIIDGMIAVVHDRRAGTARDIAEYTRNNYKIAGKTGTAQVVSQTAQDVKRNIEDIPKNQRDHGLFIAFAPAHKPEIAVVVLREHAGQGSFVAAPIAAKLIQFYLRKFAYR